MNNESGRTFGQVENIHHNSPSVRFQEQMRRDRRPKRVEVEIEPSLPILAGVVEGIKARGEEYLYMLPDTGFQVKTQVNLLLENYKNGVPISESLNQIHQDIHHFKIEYLVEQPVFAIPLEFREHKGEKQLVGSFYGGKTVVEATSDQERHGVVKEVVKQVQEDLKEAPAGTTRTFISGSGWSGYKGIEYPDTQMYCYQVQKDGSIRSFTLKTDLTLSQNEEVMRRLGVPKDAFSETADEKTRIKRLLTNGLLFSPESKTNIEDIAKTLMQVKGGNVAYKDSAGKERTFTEMFDLLRNPEPLLKIDDIQKKITNVLDEFIKYKFQNFDETTEEGVGIAIGHAVLSLMHEMRAPVRKSVLREGHRQDLSGVFKAQFSAKDTLFQLQQIGGCAGGGNKGPLKSLAQRIIESVTPRLGKSYLGNEDQEWFKCPKCDYQADGPVGNQCPGCKITMEEYAQEEGAVMCD